MPQSLYNSQNLKDRRKELRKNQTEAEKMLWSKIKNKQLDAYKFFRQYSVGPYILDFYCPLVRLAIELDGGIHSVESNKIYDKEREKFLADKLIHTIRFWNIEIFENIDDVLKIILENANFMNKQG